MSTVTTVTPTLERYDRRTIFLHWATAALVVLAWGMAQIIDEFPRGALRVDARSVHIAFGVTLLVILAIRIAHRAGDGRRLPAADKGALHVLAKATHWGLYLLLAAQVTLGVAFAFTRGDSIFNVFTLPKLWAENPDIRSTVGDLHGLIANVILILAGFHAAAALVHHYVFKDGVLRRMLPD